MLNLDEVKNKLLNLECSDRRPLAAELLLGGDARNEMVDVDWVVTYDELACYAIIHLRQIRHHRKGTTLQKAIVSAGNNAQGVAVLNIFGGNTKGIEPTNTELYTDLINSLRVLKLDQNDLLPPKKP